MLFFCFLNRNKNSPLRDIFAAISDTNFASRILWWWHVRDIISSISVVDDFGFLGQRSFIGANVNSQRGFTGLGGVNLETLRDVSATIIRLETWTVSSYRISIHVSVYRHLRYKRKNMQTIRRIVKF